MNKDSLVVSYLELRRLIGILGISLPITLVLGGIFLFEMPIQRSLSAYYHTPMSGVFTGILWAIGVFLWAYRGYDNKDNYSGNVACIAALGVALFPTVSDGAELNLTGVVHLVSAGVLFLTLAYFALWLFPQSRDQARNKIYRLCGWSILAVIGLLIFNGLVLGWSGVVFWLESIAVWAFGFSWLVKGGLR